MGKNNSSEKKLKPLIEKIKKELTYNIHILLKELDINEDLGCFNENMLFYVGGFDGEKGLMPPLKHLLWLADNNERIGIEEKKAAKDFVKHRYLNNKLPRHKYILEGRSYPDLYLENDKFIILSECKWTEPSITTKTKHCNPRDQMVRHIDCAHANNKEGKEIIAFYIVDEEFVKRKTNNEILENKLKSKEYYKESCKYLENEEEIIKRLSSYIGYLTWQQINELVFK